MLGNFSWKAIAQIELEEGMVSQCFGTRVSPSVLFLVVETRDTLHSTLYASGVSENIKSLLFTRTNISDSPDTLMRLSFFNNDDNHE